MDPPNIPTQTMQSVAPIVPQSQSKLLILLIITAFLLLFAFGTISYYLGTKQTKLTSNITSLTQTPTPTNITYPTLTTTIINEANNWNEQLITKVRSNWENFKLFYLNSWELKINRNDISQFSEISLKKGSVTLTIFQGAGDKVSCNYQDEPQKEGMAQKYVDYIEIPKGNNIIWRRSHLKIIQNNSPAYDICQRNISVTPVFLPYDGVTNIGAIYINDTSNTYDQQTLFEIDQILKKIEFVQ